MKGFVLAAGFGTRMRPVTETVPKPLLPVGQIPLIGYALRLLARHGIHDVIVNTHHLARTLKDQLGDGSRFDVSIEYSDEEEILGTGGGLKRMQGQLDETFVVLNSDTVIDLDLTAALRSHHESGALATMVLREDPNHASYGAIEIDDEGRVRRILGEGRAEGPLRPFMFTGSHVLNPRFLEYLPPEVESCVIRYGYRKALDNEEPIHGYIHAGDWMDAGTPERYFQVHDAALARELTLHHADPLTSVGGVAPAEHPAGVFLDPTATVADSATLIPPVSIGPGARVGADAVVGPATVLREKSTVAKGVRAEHSVVLPGAKVDTDVADALVAKKSRLLLNR